MRKMADLLGSSLRKKLIMLVAIALVPMLALTIYLLTSLLSYSSAYDSIVSNMTIANSYNLNFKNQIDENAYKMVATGEAFEKPSEDSYEDASDANPYKQIYELRRDFNTLVSFTTDSASRRWLNNLLRNIDTLEERVDDLVANLSDGEHYTENIRMLDNDIYNLTELIQDDIQYYIYYQTQSIEKLKDSLTAAVRSLTGVLIGILILVLAGVAAVTIRIMHSVTGPLEELREVTERIAHGDFNARAGIRTKDEIAQVAGSVNDMAEHLGQLVDQIKEDERKMRHTELRLLQEQINPHFLYNALDTIVWLIEAGRNEEAVDMVVSLSDFFRLVLSHGKEFITIREEELHVRSYLQIQQVRYRDILTYDISIDPQLYNYKILKLTLQPLVENALYHGIKNKRAMGHLDIRGHMTGGHTIILEVEDDGVGMSQEELERLRAQIELPCQETDKGFGMANVNERIRMNFGRKYGLAIDSEQGRGTRVTITIPAEWVGEESTGLVAR